MLNRPLVDHGDKIMNLHIGEWHSYTSYEVGLVC